MKLPGKPQKVKVHVPHTRLFNGSRGQKLTYHFFPERCGNKLKRGETVKITEGRWKGREAQVIGLHPRWRGYTLEVKRAETRRELRGEVATQVRLRKMDERAFREKIVGLESEVETLLEALQVYDPHTAAQLREIRKDASQ